MSLPLVQRVSIELSDAGLLQRNNGKTKKGTGFVQPLIAHEHWHMDIAYLNIAGTFYFLATVLDGFSRSVVHWDIREKMEEVDIEIILQRAKEKYPFAKPRMITDNGPQFIAKDFKEFVRISGMTHVRTSPYYPQSNGKVERFNKTIKGECIRPGAPLSKDDAIRIVTKFVSEYNEVRLHSAIGYVTPKDMLEGRQKQILDERDAKLEAARERRSAARRKSCSEKTSTKPPLASDVGYSESTQLEDKALLGSNLSAALMSNASLAGVVGTLTAPAGLTCI